MHLPPYRSFLPLVLMLLLLARGLSADEVAAQSPPQKLLNGLSVSISPQPGAEKFLLELSIKSGAAFDLAGKEGTMALLADSLTPEATTLQDITEEMGGRLTVAVDYDVIKFTAEGRPADFERYVEILRGALVGAPPTAETVDKLRQARIAVLRQAGSTPAAVADRAIAARLFGTHPYGRPITGTVESLARVQHTDLLFARERFLHPNNSTLTVAGNLDEKRVLRTLRQLLGFWRRSETVVPATFRQPGAFDARTLVIDLPDAESAEVRLAARGFATNTRDAAAADLLAHLALERWRTSFPEAKELPLFVRHEARTLGGVFTMGAAVPVASAARALETARASARSLVATAATPEELLRAQSEQRRQAPAAQNYEQISASDLKQAAAKLFPDEHAATVALGSAAQLNTQLQRLGSVEILGATQPPPPAAAAPTSAPIKMTKPAAPPFRP